MDVWPFLMARRSECDAHGRCSFEELSAQLQNLLDKEHGSSIYSTHDSAHETSLTKLLRTDGHAESAYTFVDGLGPPKQLTGTLSNYYTTPHDEIPMARNIPSPSVDGLQVADGYLQLDIDRPAAQDTNESNYSEVRSPPTRSPPTARL